ncbi:phosphoenolpyruvate carboxylase [Oecophyllibacter saccharovorans]|nr:phosphoenolpyruvate carboxylase [Oecophyllibacter saccharovorans]
MGHFPAHDCPLIPGNGSSEQKRALTPMTHRASSRATSSLPSLTALTQQLVTDPAHSHTTLSELITSLAAHGESGKGMEELENLVRELRDRNFEGRAQALRRYIDLDGAPPTQRLKDVAAQLVGQADEPQALNQARIAAVFTAHPTFALADNVYALLSRKAADPQTVIPQLPTHRRPGPPTLPEELGLALQAITRGRDALDVLNREILLAGHKRWPEATLTPAPVLLASWVGFDTDGRNDIGWWDTIRIRLELKCAQLERLADQLEACGVTDSALGQRVLTALEASRKQHAACPRSSAGSQVNPEAIAGFARQLIALEKTALLDARELAPLFTQTRQALSEERKLQLDTARAGFMAHGLGLSHMHTRLNAAQIYNVARTRLGLTDDPTLPSQRRVLLSRIDEAMTDLKPVPVDFGGLLVEPSAAARLMMTMAQILKHIDAGSPIRFLIAETESGYTLLATLWLARLFGIQDHQIDISPLFETESALENGETILEEAFRSRHWRDYLRANGKLSLQFGYSDSGRYVGQLAAGTLVERLRLRALALLREHGMEDVSLLMFDTHGESIGRGAHPFSLRERLGYFSPPHTRSALKKAGIPCRIESAFQGGDGYTLFGNEALAQATIATLAEFACDFSSDEDDISKTMALESKVLPASEDPLYERPDFAVDFFSTIALKMGDLIDDPGYTALLSAFGPALIDKTGSRPSARQSDTATVTRITHPGQIRAIPNNAILQQLGWWANVVHGMGEAAQRHPESFAQLRANSQRFRQQMDFARQALAHSDLDVLRSTVQHLDPGTWLDRAANCENEEQRAHYLAIAQGLEDLKFWQHLPAMFRSIQRDHIALRSAWPEAPRMAAEEKLLHAVRFALMERIWRLSTRIPYFGPRGTITREAIATLVLCLDIPRALSLLEDLFPITAPSIVDLDFGEPGGAAMAQGFVREHEEIFRPLQRAFDLLREVGIAVMHANHSFG